MTQDEAFKAWWYSEGSQPPYTHHDCEEHTMRMCEIAWANGAYKAIAELESQEPVAWMYEDDYQRMLTSETFCKVWSLEVGSAERGVTTIPLYTHPPQRTWVYLTEEGLRLAFGKLYPNDIGLLELAENNKDYAVEAIGARHHWTAFKAGARAGEAKLKEKNT